MKATLTVSIAGLLLAGGARAQLLEPGPAPTLAATQPSALHSLPSFPRAYAGGEGLPDPYGFGGYRADPRLYAGLDFTSRLAIETSYTNPDYRPGLHYHPPGPPPAQGVAMGVGGFNLDVGARLTVPVDDRIDAFAKVGVSYRERIKHGVATGELGNLTTVGATYKLNRRQTLTAEVPLGALARKLVTGASAGMGGSVKLGF